jgi:hypothetical protein
MDSLALLCNLHGDGPETLRRLRRAGVSDLRTLFALGLEGVEPLLGRDRSAASRFLREARLLEQRQVLADAEEPLGGGQPAAAAGARSEPKPPAASERDRALDSAVSLADEPTPTARGGSGEALAAEEPSAEEQFVDYVLAPRSFSGGDSETGSAEPRHSVLAALLAAWSRGNGGLENGAPHSAEQPPSERVEAPRGSAPNGAGAEAFAGTSLPSKPNGVHGAHAAEPGRAERAVSGPIQLAQFLQPSAVEPGLERSIESLRRSRAAAEPGEAAETIALERALRSWEPAAGASAASTADAAPSSDSSAEPTPRPAPPALGTPLARLAAEQVDPAALAALSKPGLRTLEELLAGDPRELSRASGLPYTLLLRLQYLARRCLRGPGE